MSPEVVSGNFALAASDLWSFGVMLFMMVSGGLSPFWAGNDYKTEARVLGEITALYLQQTRVGQKVAFSVGDYKLDLPHFYSVSSEVKHLISQLIVLNPESRISADQGKLKDVMRRHLDNKRMFSIETPLVKTK